MLCVVFFRQEIEMAPCSAYGEIRKRHEQLPDLSQNVDDLADYEPVGVNENVYENPGES